MNKTCLHQKHLELKAKMVDFSGWDMPLSYGSQLDEHMAVRSKAGIFDVSHMTVFSLVGNQTEQFLSYVFANDIAKVKNRNKAIYGTILKNDGGILDDLIVYSCNGKYWIVSNCGTKSKNTSWFKKHAIEFSVDVNLMDEFSIIALQGPLAKEHIAKIVEIESASQLTAFGVMDFKGGLIARTGYTGEDGFEFIVPRDVGIEIWNKAIELGIAPIGLAARDSLRLEAGLNLYGNDMDENYHPFESGLGWTIDFSNAERKFIGRAALERIDSKTSKKITGVILKDRGVLRPGYRLQSNSGEGVILSGTFSPILQKSIALARVDSCMNDEAVAIIREKEFSVDLVSSRFLKQDKIMK